MGKSDPQTGRGQSGRTADESSGAEREVEGGEAPLSEDEKWGFTDKKGGMPSETKAGVAIVLVLIGAFGFIAWNKYGTSLKPADGIVNNGDPETENAPETPPPVPGEEMPSAFDTDESQVRVAANEEEIFGSQGEPAPVQASPAGDLWESEPTTAATTPAPAQAAPVDPDAFGGFDDTAMAPAATPVTEPAAMAQSSPSQPDAFEASADPFGDAAPVQTQQPAPAATATAQIDPDPWGSAASVAAAPAATEPEPFDPGFGADPIDTAQAQPGRVAVDSAPATDLFGDNFDPAPAVQQQPVQQPASVADTGFGDDTFGGGAFDDGGFNPEPMPAATPREPAPVAQPAPEPVTVVSQPAPAQKTDPFEAADARVDFQTAPVRRDTFQPKPVQRYDRGTTRTTERFVDEPPPGRRAEKTASYTVKASDTYWGISKKVYGTSKYYRALAKYNENVIPDPRRMRPGTQLAVPTIATLERSYPKLFPQVRNASVRTTIDTRKPAGLYVDANDRPVYRVGSNDSLSRIAERHLGTSTRWKQIFELNRGQLKSPTSIRPGMLLAMPMDASQVSYR